MDKRIKYLLVVDIETANILEDAIAYDIGFAVTDKRGNIYETGSYMIADMFFDYPDLLDTAYYKEKLPQYWTDYENGNRKLAKLTTVKKIIADHLLNQRMIKVIQSSPDDIPIFFGLHRTHIRDSGTAEQCPVFQPYYPSY